jgi:PAB-dependent poly(A)-specific ribonuclease subunit 2
MRQYFSRDKFFQCGQLQVHDYLTKFSGIKPGDLDPSASTKHLTTLKAMYLKLLYMVDRGVVFVGHGLANDFRVINIYVRRHIFCTLAKTVRFRCHPNRSSTLSTCSTYLISEWSRCDFSPGTFSVRTIQYPFSLCDWPIAGENIQAETHDSVEDARTALRVYKKFVYDSPSDTKASNIVFRYLELTADSAETFEKALNDLYETGRRLQWKVPDCQ